MIDEAAMKAILGNNLRASRRDLLWKLDGLSEKQLRSPQTPTGLNLLGIVKHMAGVEIGYFGDTFGRPWPNHDEVITLEEFDNDPQADWFATETQTSTSIVDLYRRVWDFADETFASLPLDAIGAVPHWPADRNTVTLAQMMTHVLVDLTRHLGQADVIREAIDGQVGLNATNPNMPEDQNWDAYLAKLRRLADNA